MVHRFMVPGRLIYHHLTHPNKGESPIICECEHLGGNHEALPYIFGICCNLEIHWI